MISRVIFIIAYLAFIVALVWGGVKVDEWWDRKYHK